MPTALPVHLPDCFYLPRYTRFGFAIRDVMPWEDALAYVTDGTRFGAQFRDGHVQWLLFPGGPGCRASDYRLASELLPPTLHIEKSSREIVHDLWRDNAVLLAQMDHGTGMVPAV